MSTLPTVAALVAHTHCPTCAHRHRHRPPSARKSSQGSNAATQAASRVKRPNRVPLKRKRPNWTGPQESSALRRGCAKSLDIESGQPQRQLMMWMIMAR